MYQLQYAFGIVPKPPNYGMLMKMALKHENEKFSALTIKPVSGPIDLGNRPKTLKPWAITHENDLKTRKRQVIGHDSKTCIGSNMPWESPQNPKTVGKSS